MGSSIIIRREKAVVRKIATSYQITNFLTKKGSNNISVAVGKAINHTEITKNTESDWVYYVLSGKIVIDGESCEAGDVVFVPRNTEYQFGGTFEALVVNCPAFDPKFEVTKLIEVIS